MATPAAQPSKVQIARALRITNEVAFEYDVTVRGPTDIGVLRLPLRFGEKVLTVSGADGWKVDGESLDLPITGREGNVIGRPGSLLKTGTFVPDGRAPYEWWLIESDPEHHVTTSTDARPMDPSESPMVRTQPSAHLFLMHPGQHIDVAVQSLTSTDVLAATVKSHQRTMVLTALGDVVTDETLAYDNNGLDYLLFALFRGARRTSRATGRRSGC